MKGRLDHDVGLVKVDARLEDLVCDKPNPFTVATT